MNEVSCSRCGGSAEYLAIHKNKVLCFYCFIESNKTAAAHLAQLLTIENIKSKQWPPKTEPFGCYIGVPSEIADIPYSGAKPTNVQKLRIKRVKTQVWTGMVEKKSNRLPTKK